MTNDKKVTETAPGKRARIKPSLTTALVLGFGALIVIGMGMIQGITMWSAQKNTRELLADNARFAVVSLVRETRRRLSPVRDLSEYVTRMIDTGQIDLDDRAALAEALLTSMAGTEQVFGMGFVYPDGTSVRVRRGRGQLSGQALESSLTVLNALTEARRRYQPYWEEPTRLTNVGATIISIRSPI